MKRFLMVGILLLSVIGFSTIGFAGTEYCNKATVVKTGVASTGYVVYLRNDSGQVVGTDDGWGVGETKEFMIHPSISDAALATALTAISLGEPVLAGSPNSKYPKWGYISYIYLSK